MLLVGEIFYCSQLTHPASGTTCDPGFFNFRNVWKFKVPILFGTTSLLQEVIVTNGILESCILGVQHGLVVYSHNKRIFFARDYYLSSIYITTCWLSVIGSIFSYPEIT